MPHASPSRDIPLLVDSRRRIAFVTWPDVEPTIPLCREVYGQLFADPRFVPDFGVLSDRRQLRTAPPPAFIRESVQLLAEYRREVAHTGPWATVLAPDRPAAFGMGRMHEIISELDDLRYRAFTDFDAAVRWLLDELELADRRG